MRHLGTVMMVVGLLIMAWPYLSDVMTSVTQRGLGEQFLASMLVAETVPSSGSGESRRLESREPFRMLIPRIGLDAVVVSDTSVEALRKGPGHYPGTAMPGEKGNCAIAGHRSTYGHPFKEIGSLQPGDLIVLETPEEVFPYYVTRTTTIGPDDGTVLLPTDQPTLTLTTCHPYLRAYERMVVQARLGKQGQVVSRLKALGPAWQAPTIAPGTDFRVTSIPAGSPASDARPSQASGARSDGKKERGPMRLASTPLAGARAVWEGMGGAVLSLPGGRSPRGSQ